MKTKLTKYTLLIIATLFSYQLSYTQQSALRLVYDDTGNREVRKVIYFKVAPPPPAYKADSTEIGNALYDGALSIYPNPVYAMLNIESTTEIEGATLFLYDVNGRLIATETFNGLNQQLDMSAYSTGTYFLHLRKGEEDFTWQVLKQ